MLHLALSLLLSQGGFFLERLSAHGMVGKIVGGVADKVVTLKITSPDEDSDSSDSDDDTDSDTQLEVTPPTPPTPAHPRDSHLE